MNRLPLLLLLVLLTVLAEPQIPRLRAELPGNAECFSFPGSAWERDAPEAPPRLRRPCEAEPRKQCVPRQSLGTRQTSKFSGETDESLPPLEIELLLHGGAHLYEPEGDKRNWPPADSEDHYQVLRLPEDWIEPQPITAFQDFLGADPVHPRSGLHWFGDDGYQWEPRFVAAGSYEMFAIVLEEGGDRQDGIGHQLLLDLDLRITGTERAHVQFRPLGRKNSGGSILRLNDPVHYDDNSTLIPDRWWIEGEVFSIFGGLLNNPFIPRDYQVVLGKFPFALHNSLLIDDDVTGIIVNKNTLIVPSLSNLNVQAFVALDDVDSAEAPSPDLFGMHLTADYRHALLELTYAYLLQPGDSGRSADYAAFSATQFFGPLTLAGRVLFKHGDEAGRGDGQLFVLESNLFRYFPSGFHEWTGIEHGVFYATAFHATEGWDPISGGNFDRLRSTFEVDPLVAITRGRRAVETTGVALGVQLFRHDEDESIIPEVAWEAPDGESVGGFGVRYLRKLSTRWYFEGRTVSLFSADPTLERHGAFLSTFFVF